MEEIELKKKMLKLLEEDEEFRYAVSGLIGMKAILDEIKEVMRRLEEHDRKFEQIIARLEEHDRKFEEVMRRLEQMSARLEVTIGSMGRRWGRDLEKTVLNIFRETLEKEGIKPGKVESFRFKDLDGSYTGRKGTVVQIDILVKDSELYLMEVKSHAEVDHLERLVDKVPVVERILRRKASRVYLIAVNVDEEVLERAKELGVRVIYGNVIPAP